MRSCYEKINIIYKNYLLKSFEETYYPESCKGCGKLSYVKRNQAMIDNSKYCIFYYNKDYLPPLRKISKHSATFYQSKSGTAIAYKYAKQRRKNIKNFYI